MPSSNNKSQSYVLYPYTPSLAAAVIFILVFASLTLAHFYRLIRKRTWFCIPFAIGGLFETVGYVGRALSHFSPKALHPYIIQSLLILVAPALFAASVYMVLGRLVRGLHAEHHSIIRSTWLTKIFVTGDVLSFFVQGAGGGIWATATNSSDPTTAIKSGQNIILGGLFLQILMFGLFVVVAFIFHARLKRSPTARVYTYGIIWEPTMFMLEGVSALILFRNIFRVLEYIQGRDGYLLSREWSTYICDASPMAMGMIIFWWWYPSSICWQDKMLERVNSVEEQPNQNFSIALAAPGGERS